MLGQALLRASRNPRLGQVMSSTRLTRRVVDRFVAGDQLGDALQAVDDLTTRGIDVTLDHLGEGVVSASDATASRDAYLFALEALAPLELGPRVEVSIKLTAFGQALRGGYDLALGNALAVASVAAAQGTTITLDMEDSSTVDSTLATISALRSQFPSTGAVLQSYLHRTPQDAAALATAGSRVRLVKGAYRESPAVAWQSKAEVDRSYEQCLETLFRGDGYPMVGSHDPRMIRRALQLAEQVGRANGSYEFQMLYGIRGTEQQRLVSEGRHVRAYVPYGADWYGYFMRRLAERPANTLFFLRALASRR